MITGFFVEDRASLLTCPLTGNSFCSLSGVYFFADVEVNSLQRFQRLLEFSTTSLTIFDHESLKAFSLVRTILVRDVGAWITPEVLPSLLFPFPCWHHSHMTMISESRARRVEARRVPSMNRLPICRIPQHRQSPARRL